MIIITKCTRHANEPPIALGYAGLKKICVEHLVTENSKTEKDQNIT